MKRGMISKMVSAFGLAVALAVLISPIPAQAVTFDLSTLNYNSSTGYKDPVSGLLIFNKTGAEQNPWTEGTGSGAATIMFQSNTQGNNSEKTYLGSAASFYMPGTNGVPALYGTETTVGTGNNQFGGLYAQSTGFPFYFLFAPLGSTGFGPFGSAPTTLNSLWITGASASTDLEIVGLDAPANAGGKVIDTLDVKANSALQKVTLDWAGVTEVYILSATPGSNFGYSAASGFYVNDIEVNDPLPTPEPATMLLMGMGALGMGFLKRRKSKANA